MNISGCSDLKFWPNIFLIKLYYQALGQVCKFVLRCKKFYRIGPSPQISLQLAKKLNFCKTTGRHDDINSRFRRDAKTQGLDWETELREKDKVTQWKTFRGSKRLDTIHWQKTTNQNIPRHRKERTKKVKLLLQNEE